MRLTKPLRALGENLAPFSNKSHASPNSMKAVGAMLDEGERVTMQPTIIWKGLRESTFIGTSS
jgi:hypothetical protein